MRGMVFKGGCEVELVRFEDPKPGRGEVIVEMKASGMSGSDMHFYRNKPSDVIKSLGFKDMALRGIDENAPVIGGRAAARNGRPASGGVMCDWAAAVSAFGRVRSRLDRGAALT